MLNDTLIVLCENFYTFLCLRTNVLLQLALLRAYARDLYRMAERPAGCWMIP